MADRGGWNQNGRGWFNSALRVYGPNCMKSAPYAANIMKNINLSELTAKILMRVRRRSVEASKFNYMLLGRLQADCDYFLGYGDRCEKHLWAGNAERQIAKMREIYKSLPVKPVWLSRKDINRYAAQMGVK